MTELSLDDRVAARIAVELTPRPAATVSVLQDSDAIGCAPVPGTLRRLARRIRPLSAAAHALPGHGWRDVAAAWFLMAAAAAVLVGCLSLKSPEPAAYAGYRLPTWVDTQSPTD